MTAVRQGQTDRGSSPRLSLQPAISHHLSYRFLSSVMAISPPPHRTSSNPRKQEAPLNSQAAEFGKRYKIKWKGWTSLEGEVEKEKGEARRAAGKKGKTARFTGLWPCQLLAWMCWNHSRHVKKKKKTSFPRDDSEVELLTLKKFLHVFAMGMKKNYNIWGRVRESKLPSVWCDKNGDMESTSSTNFLKSIASVRSTPSISSDSNLLVHFTPPPIFFFFSSRFLSRSDISMHNLAAECTLQVLNMLHNALCRKNSEWLPLLEWF